MSHYTPDKFIAETFVRHGDKRFRVYTYERDSSAAEGPRRFEETLVHEWDAEARQLGDWVGQHSGRGVAFHCLVVTAYGDKGTFDEDDCRSSYQKAQQVLEIAVRNSRQRET